MKCFSELVNSAKLSKPYIAKSAIFGGSFKVKMVVEAVSALTQRENMKVFDTKTGFRLAKYFWKMSLVEIYLLDSPEA